METLIRFGHSIPQEAIEYGLLKKPPLRFQEVQSGNLKFVLDVAHNALGLEKLMREAQNIYPGKISVILGVSNMKNPSEFVETMAQHSNSIYLTSWHHDMLVSLQDIREIGLQVCPEKIERVEELAPILEDMISENRDQLVIICGSFYLLEGAVHELRRLGLGIDCI